jgi:hypothetical protein
MGMKSDTYQTRVCGHHPETCTCRDLDIAIKLEEITREERESELKKLRVTDVSECVHPLAELVSGDEGLFCCKCQKYVRSNSHIH